MMPPSQCEAWNLHSFNLKKHFAFFSFYPECFQERSITSFLISPTSSVLKIFCIHQCFIRHSGVFGILSLPLASSVNFSRLWLKTYSKSKHLISSVPSPSPLSSTSTFHFFLPTFDPENSVGLRVLRDVWLLRMQWIMGRGEEGRPAATRHDCRRRGWQRIQGFNLPSSIPYL